MSVEARDIMFFFAANRADNDTDTEGGAIDKSTKCTFKDLGAANSTVQAFGEINDANNNSKQLVVIGRDATGALISENINTGANALNGGTASTTTFERILRVHQGTVADTVVDQSNTGAFAVVSTSATNQKAGTAAAGTAGAEHSLTLPTSHTTPAEAVSAVDDAYKGWVVRISGGTGAGQLREVVRYVASTKKIYVRPWGTTPDNTSTYVLYEGGVVMETATQSQGSNTKIKDVCRPFYNIAASPTAAVTAYQKVFCYNCNSTTTLSNATLEEDSASGDATLKSKIDFALEENTSDVVILNGTSSITNRLTSPSAVPPTYSFGNGPQTFGNSGNFSPTSGQGVWMRLQLGAGDAANNAEYPFKVAGQTV